MDEALGGWLFFIMMLLWRSVSKTKMVLVKMGPRAPYLQWYVITGLGLVLFLIRTMRTVVRDDYIHAHFFDPAVIKSKIQNIPDTDHVKIVDLPGWLRWMSLFAPLIGSAGFAISIWKSLRLLMYGLGCNSQESLLHRCIDKLLIVIGVPQVFVLFSLRALIRQWDVITWRFCWLHWEAQAKCPDADTTRFLLRDECKLDMYFAQAIQFYAMWQFSELCGFFMTDTRIRWCGEADRRQNMKKYRKTIKWASGLGLYVFAGIGMLKSVFEFGMTVILHMMPWQSAEVCEQIGVVQQNVNSVFIFATIVCIINMFLISRVDPLTDAMGKNINFKFHGTRMMLLVLQVQPQVLKWWAVLDEDQTILLNATLVLYWCFSVSVVSAIVWENPSLEQTVETIDETARKIDEDTEGPNDQTRSGPLEARLLA